MGYLGAYFPNQLFALIFLSQGLLEKLRLRHLIFPLCFSFLVGVGGWYDIISPNFLPRNVNE